jgi:hypothetical protein
MEISRHACLKVLSWNFPDATEENHETLLLGQSISKPGFKLSTYQTQV